MSKKHGEDFGYKGIMNSYSKKLFLSGLKLPFKLSLIPIIFFIYSNEIPYEIIISTLEMEISILPNLIGFTLAGYAMLIGFGNKSFLAFLIENDDPEVPSVFELTNSVFAFSLIFQIGALVSAIILKIVVNMSMEFLFDSVLFCSIFNWIIFWLILLVFLYAVFTVKDMVINVFNFGSLHRHKIKQEMDIEKTKLEKEKNNSAQI